MRHSSARTLACGILALVVSSPAIAGGIALNWAACVADGGVSNVDFACNTNAGFRALVPSFVLDDPLTSVGSVTGTIDIVSETATLPGWWDLDICRSGSILAFRTSIAPSLCTFWNTGSGTGSSDGIVYFVTGVGGPNTARFEFRSSSNVPLLAAGSERVVTALRINFNRTVGTPSCGGCGTGVCLELKQLTFSMSPGPTFFSLTTPMTAPGDNLATWQGGGSGPGNTCEAVVGSRRSAWGAIKSLYR